MLLVCSGWIALVAHPARAWQERADWARDEFQVFRWDGTKHPVGSWNRDQDLRISAQEQVAFLKGLHRNDLPSRVEHQRLVKDLMINEAGRDWILRAKTGWQARNEPQYGWWVGWVEWPEGPVFFALNIDMPHGGADAPKREGIARAVLRSIRALPAE